MNVLIFNGRRSDEFGLFISGNGTFSAPARSVEKVVVPGRSGVLYYDNGTFDNISVKYETAVIHEMKARSDAIREWLLSSTGYCRLEDTYHPDFFRLARYAGGVDFSDFTQYLRAAKLTMEFDSRPERFLKYGDEPIAVASGSSLWNPTPFTALPVLKMTLSAANASVAIGECKITISGASGDVITLDAETMNATLANGNNANAKISMTDHALRLPDGGTTVTYSGLSNLQITPRWWTI